MAQLIPQRLIQNPIGFAVARLDFLAQLAVGPEFDGLGIGGAAAQFAGDQDDRRLVQSFAQRGEVIGALDVAREEAAKQGGQQTAEEKSCG